MVHALYMVHYMVHLVCTGTWDYITSFKSKGHFTLTHRFDREEMQVMNVLFAQVDPGEGGEVEQSQAAPHFHVLEELLLCVIVSSLV